MLVLIEENGYIFQINIYQKNYAWHFPQNHNFKPIPR